MDYKTYKHVDIYTDGACQGNPGPGGYGAILVYKGRGKEISGRCDSTTNNRMELTAVIEALRCLKESCDVTITTDSRYVSDAFNQDWITGWLSRGGLKSDGSPVLNWDLWKLLWQLLSEQHSYSFIWVRGHNGHPYNERCDRLAVNAISSTSDSRNSHNWCSKFRRSCEYAPFDPFNSDVCDGCTYESKLDTM